ncbi:uncharacterized protein JCM6883_003937 [Sporobolomyces salmoneus]|uniref:uncharacterized protein n=1 Tax=Sporobolomyces salmoneus TaxID=183962 RepID=UPI003178D724
MSQPSENTSPEAKIVLEHLQSQSNLLRSSSFSTPTLPISIDQALSNVEQFKGKVVVITGAAGIGFGAHYSKKVAKYGAKVVLSDLKLEAVQEVVDEIKAAGGEATGIACNVLDWDAQVRMFRHAIDTYGKIDIVFANAGTSSETDHPLLGEETDANGEPKKPSTTTLDVNTTGVIYTVKLGFYHLSRNPAKTGKSIVILGSMASFFGIPGAPLYTASKHAVLGFMRSLYHNAKAENISISTINPFFCHTGIFGFLPLLALSGIPLATLDDVIGAMIYASTAKDLQAAPNEEVNGSSFLVDWKGILQIPYNATAGSSAVSLESGTTQKGYYKIFEERASAAIYSGKVVKDIVYALKSLIWDPRKRA